MNLDNLANHILHEILKDPIFFFVAQIVHVLRESLWLSMIRFHYYLVLLKILLGFFLSKINQVNEVQNEVKTKIKIFHAIHKCLGTMEKIPELYRTSTRKQIMIGTTTPKKATDIPKKFLALIWLPAKKNNQKETLTGIRQRDRWKVIRGWPSNDLLIRGGLKIFRPPQHVQNLKW